MATTLSNARPFAFEKDLAKIESSGPLPIDKLQSYQILTLNNVYIFSGIVVGFQLVKLGNSPLS